MFFKRCSIVQKREETGELYCFSLYVLRRRCLWRRGFLFSSIPTGQPYQYVIVDLASEGDQSERCSVAWNANVLGSEGTTTEDDGCCYPHVLWKLKDRFQTLGWCQCFLYQRTSGHSLKEWSCCGRKCQHPMLVVGVPRLHLSHAEPEDCAATFLAAKGVRFFHHGMLSESHQPINSIWNRPAVDKLSRLPKILESHALLHFPVSDEALGSCKVDVFLSITDCMSLWCKLRFSSATSSEPLVHQRIPWSINGCTTGGLVETK